MKTKSVESILKKYPSDQTQLLAILQEINQTQGCVDRPAMIAVADYLNMSPATIYGTATFYHLINTKPKGSFVIRLCQSLSCDLNNKQAVATALQNALKISFGETTPDKLFTLEYTNCMGMCDQGPAMLVNDRLYGKLTPENVVAIISELKTAAKKGVK